MSVSDDTSRQTIAFEVKAAKLTGEVLKALIKHFLEKANGQNKHGKMSVKQLMGKNDPKGLTSIEIADDSGKEWKRTAAKYGIDYAIKKDKTADPPKYIVFFETKNTDVLNQAFKEFVYKNEKRKDKGEHLTAREKFEKAKEKAKGIAEKVEKVQERVKNKTREASL